MSRGPDRRALGLILSGATAIAIAVPTTAGAAVKPTLLGPDDRLGDEGGISIDGGKQGERIKVSSVGRKPVKRGTALVIKSSRRISPGVCERVTKREVRCEPIGSRFDYISVNSAGGKDVVRFSGRVNFNMGGDGPSIDGGEGRDKLVGSNADDLIGGGEDNDLERGRGGRDTIGMFDPGADRLFGNSGNDTLVADSKKRKRVAHCGKGRRDVLELEGRKPKTVKGCEKIARF